MKTLERRLKLLEKEGEGLSKLEIVKELSVEFQCSDRTVYHDFQNRVTWQPSLQQLTDQKALLFKVLNRLEQCYRMASRKFLTSGNESVQVCCLKVMIDINAKIFETGIVPDLLGRLSVLEDKAKKYGLLEE